MPTYDYSDHFPCSVEGLWKALLATSDHLVTVHTTEPILFAATDDEYGYLYFIDSDTSDSATLRCVAHSAVSLRAAFSRPSVEQAIRFFMAQPTAPGHEEEIGYRVRQRLQSIRNYVEGGTVKQTQTPIQLPHDFPSNPDLLTAFSFLISISGAGLVLALDWPLLAKSQSVFPTFLSGIILSGIILFIVIILFVLFYVSTIIVGIVLAQNWRRLGKPRWVIPTFLTDMALPILTILFAVFGYQVGQNYSLPFIVLILPAVISLTASITFVFTVAAFQRPAYKIWKTTKDFQQVAAHAYPPQPARRWAVVYAIIFGAIAISPWLSNAGDVSRPSVPQHFTDQNLSLTYDGAWTSLSLEKHGGCAFFVSPMHCILMLSYLDWGTPNILIIAGPLKNDETVQKYEADNWHNYVIAGHYTEYGAANITIGGQPAVLHKAAVPQTQEPDPLFYLFITVIDHRTVYKIWAWSASPCIFDDKCPAQVWPTLNAIKFAP